MNEKQDVLEFQVFKGLQRPLEFLGLQGRYIVWGAAGAVGGIVAFIISYIVIGFITALVLTTVIVGVMMVMIMIKKSKGLHSKKMGKGIYIFARSLNRF